MSFEGQKREAERNQHAAYLVIRVHDGSASAYSEAADWINADPANAVAYARAEAAWEAAAPLADRPPPDAEPAPSRSVIGRRAFAAGLIATAGAGLGLGIPSIRRLMIDESIDTGVGERRDIKLADGSIVRLNTASRVEVCMTAKARIVRLIDGEALFDVAHDPQRPFLVDVGHSRIRAVGTEFNIRMRRDLVELTVTEGTVAVAKLDDSRPLGEQPHFSAGSGVAIRQGIVARTSLDAEGLRQRTAWREGVIELNGNTVEQAVAEFNRYRATPVVIADERVATLRIGGRFGTSESDRFIVALQQALPVRAIAGDDGAVLLVQAD